MPWYKRNRPDSVDVEDEASVGLITPESEKRRPRKERQAWISKSSLSVALVLSNVAWAGLCLMLWRELNASQNHALASREGLDADFGTSALNT